MIVDDQYKAGACPAHLVFRQKVGHFIGVYKVQVVPFGLTFGLLSWPLAILLRGVLKVSSKCRQESIEEVTFVPSMA